MGCDDKGSNNGQKTQIKERLMMQGFEEVEKPLSDSPTLGKESLKVLVA